MPSRPPFHPSTLATLLACSLLIGCQLRIARSEGAVDGRSREAGGAAPDTLVRLPANNPDAVVDLSAGLWAHPLPMDFDGDGDMDLLVSSVNTPSDGLYFFENTSGEAVPVFAPPVRLGDGIRNVQISYVEGRPVVMAPGGILEDFARALDARRTPLFPADSLTKGIARNRFNQWKQVDFDGDGDQDLLVGVDSWDDYGWDNAYDAAGRWTNGPLHGWVWLLENVDGAYVDRGRLEAAGAPIDVYGSPSPSMADFDGDGDLDLILGEFLDRMTWFENTGTRERPVFAPGRFLANDAGVLHMDLEMIIPTAVDWDRDGDVDLVVGQEDGRVALVENTGAVRDRMPLFRAPAFFRQRAGDLEFGVLATPVGVDWDEDGDEDLISGNSAGYLAFLENLDGGDPPRWAPPALLRAGGETIRIMAGPNGSIQGPAEAKWGYTAPSVADWDGDGRKDILVNSIWGKVVWYRNVGRRGAPELAPAEPVRVDWDGAPPKPAWNWWSPEDGTLVTQWRTTPYAVDWNEDGRMDLVMLDHEGYLSFFERVDRGGVLRLRPGRRIFYQEIDGELAPLRLSADAAGRSGRRKLAFADWDGDGDLDLLVNSANVALLRNDGVRDGRVVFVNAGDLATRKLAGHTTSPTPVDWNRDGVPDLVIGAEDGYFYYLERH